LLLAGVLGGALLIPFASKLPLSVQRSLSFLPLDIDPVARQSAQATVEWRLGMWTTLLPEVPKYFWLGKGYAIDPTDLYLTHQAMLQGLVQDYEEAIVTGDYHNGPLCLLIPFGIWGLVGFVWLLVAGGVVLYRNYHFSEASTRNLNIFLFSSFLARATFFFVGFGSLYTDLSIFLGLFGLSVAVNGVRSRQPDEVPVPERAETIPVPAVG
jgi:hypothetical protein